EFELLCLRFHQFQLTDPMLVDAIQTFEDVRQPGLVRSLWSLRGDLALREQRFADAAAAYEVAIESANARGIPASHDRLRRGYALACSGEVEAARAIVERE